MGAYPVNIIRRKGTTADTGRSIAKWEEEFPSLDHDTYGSEGNPTGNPIGGGNDYSDVYTAGDHTVTTYDELASALEIAKAGDVVFVPEDVHIDMSDKPELPIPGQVTLAGGRGSGSGDGGMIFSDSLDTPGLFRTDGDFVRITGLRIRGPFDKRDRVDRTSNGIETTHFGLEIDNCEIWAFSVAATRFGIGASRGYVHHNYIHHNQRGGLGYGVSINGGTVLIEANLFDWCRHHIASSGAPGSGYEARYNVCLENANGHLFDMHGGRDRGDATDIAGDWMNVHHNTFKAVDVRSLVIRGVASQGSRIHHNWFYSSDPENIVRASGTTHVYQNVLGESRELLPELEVAYE
jgi:hypothetical protein